MPTLLKVQDIQFEMADLYLRMPARIAHLLSELTTLYETLSIAVAGRNWKAVEACLTQLDVLKESAQEPRPPGIHQSGVLIAIARHIPKIAATLTDGKDEEEYPLIWALGQAWEEFCVSMYPVIVHQPGAVCKNGIWRSADGQTITKLKVQGEEFKFTFKKLMTGEELLEQWLWMHQGRGYCSGYGWEIVRWHVCFARGDYRAFGPVYRRYVVRFTDKEIQQTEAMLIGNKGKAVAE